MSSKIKEIGQNISKIQKYFNENTIDINVSLAEELLDDIKSTNDDQRFRDNIQNLGNILEF